LEKRRASGKWPDVLLLDVYWPKFDDSKKVQAARRNTHHILTKEVHPAIDKMNIAYLGAFEKWGTRALREIRKRFSTRDLPIVMYSSKGHFLLRDATQDWLSETIEMPVPQQRD
jgi:CheY-like chemotaxis protein